MSKVFVLDTDKQPLNPVHPGRARTLLSQGKAAVYKRFPFTIILKQSVPNPETQPLRLKIDPGAKTTGMAIVDDATGEVVWAAELTHRGFQIRDALTSRRGLRCGRRNRHTRYRQPRFDNRTRKIGWLPPSLNSRVDNISTWVERLRRLCRIAALSQELVKFDTQLMQNSNISGVQYQQGTLAGYEISEYLLEKWNRQCTYCRSFNVPLQIEHIVPRSKGGSNRVSNLCLACESCNTKKGNQDIKDFLAKKPDSLKQILSQTKRPLADTAAVNATRWELYRRLTETGLPVEVGTGGRTKFNRTLQGLEKTHWIDAACVGTSTPEKLVVSGIKPLQIAAKASAVSSAERDTGLANNVAPTSTGFLFDIVPEPSFTSASKRVISSKRLSPKARKLVSMLGGLLPVLLVASTFQLLMAWYKVSTTNIANLFTERMVTRMPHRPRPPYLSRVRCGGSQASAVRGFPPLRRLAFRCSTPRPGANPADIARVSKGEDR